MRRRASVLDRLILVQNPTCIVSLSYRPAVTRHIGIKRENYDVRWPVYFSFVMTEGETGNYTMSEKALAQRQGAALKHGARSPDQIAASARAQKRRLLRQLGLRASDVDGVGLALLDNWSRAQAKVSLLDLYFEQRGFLDPEGEPNGAARVYFTALNSARLAATRLSEHLKACGAKGETLEDYLEERYGSNTDDDGE